MKKTIKLIIVVFISVFIMSGCGYHRKVNYQNTSYQHTSLYTPSHTIRPAHSMSDLDNQSRNVKPTLVYSYPKSVNMGNAIFVDLGAIKYKLLNYLNSVRSHGNSCGPSAPPVTWNRELELASIAHSKDMAINNFLGHLGSGKATDPARKGPGQGSNFYERIMYSGYPIKPGSLAGEILTYTKFRIVGNQEPYEHFVHAINNFLKSPAHCHIMMNPRFKDVGIAAYKDKEKMYWTIEFGEIKY